MNDEHDEDISAMSASPPKADIRYRDRDVRFVPEADIVSHAHSDLAPRHGCERLDPRRGRVRNRSHVFTRISRRFAVGASVNRVCGSIEADVNHGLFRAAPSAVAARC